MRRKDDANTRGNESEMKMENPIDSDHADFDLPWAEIMKMPAKQLADYFGIKGEPEGLKDDLRMLSDIAGKLPSMQSSDRRNVLTSQIEYIKEDYGKYHIKLNKFLERMIEEWLTAANVEEGLKKRRPDLDALETDVISKQDEETLLDDIVPMLKIRFGKLYNIISLDCPESPDINQLINSVLEKAPKLLSMHGLSHLKDSKKTRNFLIKKILDIK